MTVKGLPHWDLSNVYPDLESKEFEQAFSLARTRLGEFDRFLADNRIRKGGPVPTEPSVLAGTMAGYLKVMNALV